MKKRILAFFLAGIMTFSMVPTEAFAASANLGITAGEETGADMEEAALSEEDSPSVEKHTLTEESGQEENSPPAEEDTQKKDSQTTEDGMPVSVGQEESDEKTDLPDTGISEEPGKSSLENLEENERVEPQSEEPAEPTSIEETPAEQQSIEDWAPPMGGMLRPEVIEISEETAESLDVMDVEEEADGTMMYRSAVLGSQKYNSPWDVYSSNYIYNRLSQNERNFWDMLDEILRGYLNGTQNAVSARVGGTVYYVTEKGISYTFLGLSINRVNDLFLLFSYSNPQYYFLGNGFLSGGGAMFPIIYDGFANGNVRAAETAKVKAQIDTMVAQVAAGKTDVEKAKIAHDLICQKVMYDHDYLSSTPHTLYHQSAYSVFCENYTVCAGYAKAFMILMNGAGVDTISVTSTAHAWNMISLNDSWYNVDCTWDDTDGSVAGYGEMVYQYFNRSTAMITGKLDQYSYHQMEAFYQGLAPAATQDSGATLTSIGTIKTPSTTAATPKISKKETSGTLKVTLSTTTSGADIYYTVDGSAPSSASSKSYLYTGPFEVEHNTTVKAIAVRDTMWDSKVASKTLQKTTYTVKFNTGGYGTISSQKVISGNKAKKPTNPQRSKYVFGGWYTSKKYTTKWTFTKKVTGNMTLYAKWTKVSVGKVTIKKVTNVSGKKMKVTVKKIAGAAGYQIRYATNSKMKSPSSVTSTTISKTIKNLKKGKTYYVRVRAYKTDSKGKKIYGAWSKVKTVKIQK